MKRFAITLTIGMLLLAGAVSAAEVTNVELRYQEGYTVIRIDVDGAVRYTHQTEVPKNGKPHRVIVDILSATHALGAKSYLELPKCGVRGIRSSQFAVTPEQIVRIVLDVNTAPVYRLDTDSKSITIYLNDKSSSPFATWSSRAKQGKMKPAGKAASPAKAAPKKKSASAKAANAAIEQDRMASLSSGKQATAPAKPKAKTPTKSVQPARSTAKVTPVEETKPARKELPWYVASPDKSSEKPTQSSAKKTTAKAKSSTPAKPKTVAAKPMAEPKKSTKQATANKTVASKPKTTTNTATKSPAKTQSAPKKMAPAKSSGQQALAKKLTKKNSTANKSTKPAGTVAKKSTPPAKKSTTVAKSEPAKTQPSKKSTPKKQVASAPAKGSAESAQKPRATSRFRRSAATAKIKGTMVAEFPKRLVIKYKASGYRDPFRTLIDDTRTNDNPIERRVPNIEGLKLVGVIESGDKSNRALFEDNDGYSYMLKSGDKVRNGYVLRVEADKVYFQIFEYGWSRTVALEMEY